MKKPILVIVIAAVLLGLGETAAADMLGEAKVDASENLKDPNAAQFRKLVVVKKAKSTAVCGEMNAKNAFGAYSGFTPVIVVMMANGNAFKMHDRAVYTSELTEAGQKIDPHRFERNWLTYCDASAKEQTPDANKTATIEAMKAYRTRADDANEVRRSTNNECVARAKEMGSVEYLKACQEASKQKYESAVK